MLRKVSRQGAVVLVSRVASVLLGLGSTILLSRLLGPSGLGKFRLGSVVVQLLTGCCLIGLDRALPRYLPILEARAAGGSRTLLIRSSGVVVTISLILFVALQMGAPFLANFYFHSPEMANVIRAFSYQLPVLALFRFLSTAVTAAKRADIASRISNILSPAIFLVLLALIGLVYTSVYGAVIARISGQLAAVICLAVFLVRLFPQSSRVESVEGDTFRKYLLLSFPLFLIGLGYQLLNQMDTIMLGHFVSEKEVGIYSVAFKVSAFVLIGPDILLPIVAPLFSHFSETRDSHLTAVLFATVTKWLCYFALIVFACTAIFRIELLGIFGKGFAAGGTVLLILAGGQLANAATGPTGVLLTMTGKQKWELANTISMVGFNFFLNLFLIPPLGKTGAAIATAVSIAAINGVKLVQVYMLYGLRAHNLKYLKGLIAIGGAAAVGYLVRNTLGNMGYGAYTLLALGGIAFLVTATVGFWVVGLDEEDKLAINAVRKR